MFRTILIAGGMSVAVCAAVIVGLFLLFRSSCQNQPLAEVPSPDGKHKAIVFQRDCGSKSGFSTQVTVLPAESSLPNDSGNVFITDTDRGASPAGTGGASGVSVRWSSPINLVVSHPKAANLFTAERVAGNVEIRFEELAAH